jgi:hypothetical protein
MLDVSAGLAIAVVVTQEMFRVRANEREDVCNEHRAVPEALCEGEASTNRRVEFSLIGEAWIEHEERDRCACAP